MIINMLPVPLDVRVKALVNNTAGYEADSSGTTVFIYQRIPRSGFFNWLVYSNEPVRECIATVYTDRGSVSCGRAVLDTIKPLLAEIETLIREDRPTTHLTVHVDHK